MLKTKLVYVLTCAPEATYIEQALMSIWSARYHNPDAHIVLLVDDKTNQLLVGKRAEVLEFVTEKVVVSFEDENVTMMYRSRWMKTQVRQLVQGDLLFIDCDTIIQRPLKEIDDWKFEIGAVLESHLFVGDFCEELYNSTKEETAIIGVNIDEEVQYYSSGVLFVKDTKTTHRLYELWHFFWVESNKRKLKIDQPSLAKANSEMGHIIQQIPDSYNCIVFTHPPFVRNAHILHIASYRNPSFLFSPKVLEYVKRNGLINSWLRKMILNPFATMPPFDYMLKYSSFSERQSWVKEMTYGWNGYKKYIDETCADFPSNVRCNKIIKFMLRCSCTYGAICMYIFERYVHSCRKTVKYNICQKD